jgi:hypothetical protein
MTLQEEARDQSVPSVKALDHQADIAKGDG